LEREPFVPLRLHLASGKTMVIPYANTAWVRQNTLVIVHPLAPGTHAIGNYDVVALRLIERMEQASNYRPPKARRNGRRPQQ
jgi:hypothetical protein